VSTFDGAFRDPGLLRGALAITLDGKDVAVGILEPGDFAAAGAG
jgi:hypothetical protein